MSQTVIEARTLLFVPGNRPERFAKALASGADAVIIDLEDAVPAAEKAAARDSVARAWSTLGERGRLLIRINAPDSSHYADDVALCGTLMPAAIVVPKARVALLEALAEGVADCPLVPLVESAAGLAEVDALARCAKVLRLAFGHLDFQLDLGMQCDADEAELAPARLAVVMASRLAGCAAPIDGITLETSDDERVHAATVRARRFGFTGRLCIHPRQIAPIHAGFAPSARELAWARRVVDATSALGGSGALQVDGRMVDRPVIQMAQRLLARYGRGA
jgi:citrate lyase subunit beta/citryl-CoA lyase